MEITKLTIRQDFKRKDEPHPSRTKMYIWLNGETIMENMINRRSRPYTEYKKVIIPKVLEKIENEYPEVYREIKDSKWGWRQRCGCTCPCSPGFVSSRYGYYDISVEVS